MTFLDARNPQPTFVPRFNPDEDREGVATHVPHLDHFYENSLQTGLMRDLAVDLELLGEHLVLLGNQVTYNPVQSVWLTDSRPTFTGCWEEQVD